MLRTRTKGKIHRATVTRGDLPNLDSVPADEDLTKRWRHMAPCSHATFA